MKAYPCVEKVYTCIKMNPCFHETTNVNVTVAGKPFDLAA